MKILIAAVLLTLGSTVAVGSDEIVKFTVTVKEGDRLIASPTFLANIGRPASIRLGDSLTVEALAKPPESNGHSWTQVRITYFETEDSKFVQEMHMRHKLPLRTGSFEYTDPAQRRYVVEVGR